MGKYTPHPREWFLFYDLQSIWLRCEKRQKTIQCVSSNYSNESNRITNDFLQTRLIDLIIKIVIYFLQTRLTD